MEKVRVGHDGLISYSQFAAARSLLRSIETSGVGIQVTEWMDWLDEKGVEVGGVNMGTILRRIKSVVKDGEVWDLYFDEQGPESTGPSHGIRTFYVDNTVDLLVQGPNCDNPELVDKLDGMSFTKNEPNNTGVLISNVVRIGGGNMWNDNIFVENDKGHGVIVSKSKIIEPWAVVGTDAD